MILVVIGTFLIAGAVKGVIGLGLPSISLALLAVALDLHTAMALLLAPSLLTNLWQAAVGGHARVILVRLWPFLLMASVTIWVGVRALASRDPSLLTGLLGLLLVCYSLTHMLGIRPSIPARHEGWAGVLIGAVNGVFTGMTGSFVVPGVLFLQAIGLPRDMLIQAMGWLFTVSTLALGIALQQSNILDFDRALLSTAAVIPALLGMLGGQRLRKRLPEEQFRRIFFMSLLVLGGYLLLNSLHVLMDRPPGPQALS